MNINGIEIPNEDSPYVKVVSEINRALLDSAHDFFLDPEQRKKYCCALAQRVRGMLDHPMLARLSDEDKKVLIGAAYVSKYTVYLTHKSEQFLCGMLIAQGVQESLAHRIADTAEAFARFSRMPYNLKLNDEDKCDEYFEDATNMVLNIKNPLNIFLKLIEKDLWLQIYGVNNIPEEQRAAATTFNARFYYPLAAQLGFDAMASSLKQSIETLGGSHHFTPKAEKARSERAFHRIPPKKRKRIQTQIDEHVKKIFGVDEQGAMIYGNDAWLATFVQETITPITQRFQECGVTLSARWKTPYAIHLKTQRTENATTIKDQKDILGVRLIVHKKNASEEENIACARTVHQAVIDDLTQKGWTPSREKDYYAQPKDNGYQSLHVTLTHEDGKVFELQTRTHETHEVCEIGSAATTSYKESSKPTICGRMKNFFEDLTRKPVSFVIARGDGEGGQIHTLPPNTTIADVVTSTELAAEKLFIDGRKYNSETDDVRRVRSAMLFQENSLSPS